MTDRPALLLDLDGTLTDSVYQHALAWHKALELSGIKLSVCRIHRQIDMSGGLLAESLARETGRELSEKEAAARLGVPSESAIAIGDSVWDLLAARRARALGVGLLTGGYGQEELERAGAYRVYEDPADLLLHIDELGIRA